MSCWAPSLSASIFLLNTLLAAEKPFHETEGIVERIQNKAAMLGKVTRHLAGAGINLATVYLATDTRLVLGCENVAVLETARKELTAVASR